MECVYRLLALNVRVLGVTLALGLQNLCLPGDGAGRNRSCIGCIGVVVFDD